jgi:YfiH family protein
MPSVLRAERLREHGFLHGFSTRASPGAAGDRAGGAGASSHAAPTVHDDSTRLLEDRRRFAADVGFAPTRLFELNQVHGASVRAIGPRDEPARLREVAGDGLVAARLADAAIAIRSADCVPVLLADPTSRAVAAAHAGWRGVVAGVVPATLQALCQASGATASQLVAAVFPHIGVCCFEVGADVASQLQAAAPAVACVRQPAGASRPFVALVEIVRAQLMAAGLAAPNIEVVPGCTCCEPERFYSFRRDGQGGGRHFSAIVCAAAPG